MTETIMHEAGPRISTAIKVCRDFIAQKIPPKNSPPLAGGDKVPLRFNEKIKKDGMSPSGREGDYVFLFTLTPALPPQGGGSKRHFPVMPPPEVALWPEI